MLCVGVRLRGRWVGVEEVVGRFVGKELVGGWGVVGKRRWGGCGVEVVGGYGKEVGRRWEKDRVGKEVGRGVEVVGMRWRMMHKHVINSTYPNLNLRKKGKKPQKNLKTHTAHGTWHMVLQMKKGNPTSGYIPQPKPCHT